MKKFIFGLIVGLIIGFLGVLAWTQAFAVGPRRTTEQARDAANPERRKRPAGDRGPTEEVGLEVARVKLRTRLDGWLALDPASIQGCSDGRRGVFLPSSAVIDHDTIVCRRVSGPFWIDTPRSFAEAVLALAPRHLSYSIRAMISSHLMADALRPQLSRTGTSRS